MEATQSRPSRMGGHVNNDSNTPPHSRPAPTLVQQLRHLLTKSRFELRSLHFHRLAVTKLTPTPAPWKDIEPNGSNLTVEDFLSVPIVRLAAHLKRFPSNYANSVGLTLPQWRLLSTVAHHGSIPLKQLAEVSASDKALVSRTVKELAARELVSTASMKNGDRSLVCYITPKGSKVVEQVLPIAKERHARLLLALDENERVQLHAILQKLQAVCADIE